MSESRTEQVSAQGRGVRVRSSEARRGAERSAPSQRSVRAARPAAVSAPSGVVHQSCRHGSFGLSVLRRPAHRLFSSDGRCARLCLAVSPFLKQKPNPANSQRRLSLALQRFAFSSALRSTAAPGCGGRVGTAFARAAGAPALRHQNSSVAPLASARMLRHQEQGVALVVLEGLLRTQPRPNPNGTYFGVLAEGNACK